MSPHCCQYQQCQHRITAVSAVSTDCHQCHYYQNSDTSIKTVSPVSKQCHRYQKCHRYQNSVTGIKTVSPVSKQCHRYQNSVTGITRNCTFNGATTRSYSSDIHNTTTSHSADTTYDTDQVKGELPGMTSVLLCWTLTET